jgi:hypothetical protein
MAAAPDMAAAATAQPSLRSVTTSAGRYHWWRKEFGYLKSDQVKRLKELEAENARLRRAVADLMLDKLILIGGPGFEAP